MLTGETGIVTFGCVNQAVSNKYDNTALPRDNEADIDLTDNDLNVSALGEALEQAEKSTRAPCPDTPEPALPAATEETASPVNTRRHTMSLRD